MEFSALDSWGFDGFFAAALNALGRPDLVAARVVSDLGACLEIVDGAGVIRTAQPSGRLRHVLCPHERPVVGDWAAIRQPDPGDPAGPAILHHMLPRRTQLVRREPGRGDAHQVVAANVDTFFIVTSANRDINARRIERYLTTVWDGGAAPVIAVNKVDLCAPEVVAAELGHLVRVAPGVPVIGVSAHSGAGLDELAAYLRPGHTVAMIGSSGVGKSSLVNCLFARLFARNEQEVRPTDDEDRGRHTTTRRQLFALPSGGLVIDTPGMRELGLTDRGGGLDEAFAEITAMSAACRFRDCQHSGEPGCAVDAAIDAGELDPDRLEGLRKLQDELDAVERRRDPVAFRAERARLRALNRAIRARSKADPKLRR